MIGRVKFELPKVYPITDTRVSGSSHAEQVALLIGGGATLIQLREKSAAPIDFYRAAESALAVARSHGVPLIINDRVDIAIALKADGVHLGQSDMPAAAARRVLGTQAIIGVSSHNLEQAIAAATAEVDYVAIGPIFKTVTKDNPEPIAGLDELRAVRAALGTFPLVAIGGITLSNAPSVFAAGADSVASIAGIVGNPAEISENMRLMLSTAPVGHS